MNPHLWAALAATFLASSVESVEAFTVVLVVAATVNWKSSLAGAGAAVAIIGAVTALLGAAVVRYVPVETLRLVVGGLLVLFGLKWAKKSILGFGGLVERRDEAEVYRRMVADMESRRPGPGSRFDRSGVAATFKGVLPRGLEVTFVVLTFGALAGVTPHGDGIVIAAAGAALALAVVAAAGGRRRSPLRGVPENALTFLVGIILTAYGTFWGGEAFGIRWWGGDLFLIALALFYGVLFGIMVLWVHSQIEMSGGPVTPSARRRTEP